jgi:hypothetical protein
MAQTERRTPLHGVLLLFVLCSQVASAQSSPGTALVSATPGQSYLNTTTVSFDSALLDNSLTTIYLLDKAEIGTAAAEYGGPGRPSFPITR